MVVLKNNMIKKIFRITEISLETFTKLDLKCQIMVEGCMMVNGGKESIQDNGCEQPEKPLNNK